ncbi:MAG: hypothetical protein K0A90_07345 [Methanosarcinaceae archaeon]|nr:hypothetical protein [Methanosarcinaceae archaeon]
MEVTSQTIYRELKLLRSDISELKSLLVPEVKPTEDEVKVIKLGQKEFKTGEFTDWKDIKAKMSSDI